ncbi:porin [Acinetobacter sp. CAAS 2-6]|uniref:porin n=1 Tax=Acinetobacter sp. CAAS 2-6 TaxID=3016358 RepID=UPI002DD6A1EF|nr:porin [Acinetobacter sp. CAAS 2-6]
MKTKIALAITLGLAASSGFAAPTLYGEIDASVDYLPEDNATTKDRDVWEVSSNSSFIGVKGEEKLSPRLSAVYAIEWGLSADGDSTDWTTRNRFVGLKDSKLGTLKAGAHDTPLKQLSSAVDTFNNYVANKADVTGIMTGENRVSNAVVYESPAIVLPVGALKLNALLASGENKGIDKGNGSAKTAGRGLGDAWSASLVYESPVVVAGVAYDKAIPSNFLGRGILNTENGEISSKGSVFAAANTVRAIGRVNLDGGLALKALYQTSEAEETANASYDLTTEKGLGDYTKWLKSVKSIDDAQGWLVGAEYNLANAKAWTVKAQYSQNTTSFKDATADFEAKQVIAGVDYAFNKQVKAYGYAGYLTLEQADQETKQPVVGSGLEIKF